MALIKIPIYPIFYLLKGDYSLFICALRMAVINPLSQARADWLYLQPQPPRKSEDPERLRTPPHVSYSLKSSKGGYIGDNIGETTIGLFKGDTRSLDYSSCSKLFLCAGGVEVDLCIGNHLGIHNSRLPLWPGQDLGYCKDINTVKFTV